jgi:hypothetical protein
MNNNDPFHERLKSWKFEPTIPPRFQAEVWSRIRAREDERTDTSLAAFVRWLFPSPAAWQFVAATVVMMLVLGATLGNVVASASNDRDRAVLAERYAQMVDPYLRVFLVAAK